MITNNEKERIATYQRGWNDAQRDREPAIGESLMYQIGYLDGLKRLPRRFVTHESEVH